MCTNAFTPQSASCVRKYIVHNKQVELLNIYHIRSRSKLCSVRIACIIVDVCIPEVILAVIVIVAMVQYKMHHMRENDHFRDAFISGGKLTKTRTKSKIVLMSWNSHARLSKTVLQECLPKIFSVYSES